MKQANFSSMHFQELFLVHPRVALFTSLTLDPVFRGVGCGSSRISFSLQTQKFEKAANHGDTFQASTCAVKSTSVWVYVCVWVTSDSVTVICQAPLSIGFSRQEYWSGCHSLLQKPTNPKGQSSHMAKAEMHSAITGPRQSCQSTVQ